MSLDCSLTSVSSSFLGSSSLGMTGSYWDKIFSKPCSLILWIASLHLGKVPWFRTRNVLAEATRRRSLGRRKSFRACFFRVLSESGFHVSPNVPMYSPLRVHTLIAQSELAVMTTELSSTYSILLIAFVCALGQVFNTSDLFLTHGI